MVTAIVLALVVSATAAVVLNMTFRRFELSAFRTDRAVGGGTSEAGFQYAFARMDKDRTYTALGATGFREVVQARRNALGAGAVPANTPLAEFVVTCHDAAAADESQVVAAIHMGGIPDAGAPGGVRGGKHLTVRIRFFTAADRTLLPPAQAAILATRPYRVHSISNFGTGEQ
jgi:hypothetical protein